ncbi:MAG: agmatine deiminase family protein [Desulfitobacteriaceae bacterium]|nr:agmatine deiminase family protein [Desulfitobacteriaceae bacterium]
MYPNELNYKMPAEWAEHDRTLISWPVQSSMCYPEDYEAVCLGYAEIIKAITEFEPVTIVVNSTDAKKVSCLFHNVQIKYLEIEHNDSWIRDNGPTFIFNEEGEVAGVNWKFNAWGGKYAPWDLDDQIACQVLRHFGIECFDAPLVMEGGSFHVDGEGTLITTEECLLNPNRNPELTREQIENELKKILNIDKVIWLKNGLDGDETDGHVDNIACFAAPGKILMQVCNDQYDKNYAITRENLKVINSETDALGRKFKIIPIQQPPQMFHNNKRLTLSYLNFYFVNGGIILPVFGGQAQGTDRLAVEILSEVFSQRRVRTVNGMLIINEGGNVHCMTQQMPMGRKKGYICEK